MTLRGFLVLPAGLLLLALALATGLPILFLSGAAALMVWGLSLVSVLLPWLTCHARGALSQRDVLRSGTCPYTLILRLLAPLPIAPLRLHMNLPYTRNTTFELSVHALRSTQSQITIPCPHVGVFPVGVAQIDITDVFGLFHLSRRIKADDLSITVLPIPRETAPLPVPPGEGEESQPLRAQSDPTTPADTRPWQDGDELKRVHWKLSMRKQMLMVHTYETPLRPDSLILLDMGLPPGLPPVRRALTIDALTETATGVLSSLLAQSRSIRLPLRGFEESGQHLSDLPRLQKSLAQVNFNLPSRFPRLLQRVSVQMRQAGSLIVLTSSLSSQTADLLLALASRGAQIRIYTILPRDAQQQDDTQKLLRLLRSCGIDTVTIPMT